MWGSEFKVKVEALAVPEAEGCQSPEGFGVENGALPNH